MEPVPPNVTSVDGVVTAVGDPPDTRPQQPDHHHEGDVADGEPTLSEVTSRVALLAVSDEGDGWDGDDEMEEEGEAMDVDETSSFGGEDLGGEDEGPDGEDEEDKEATEAEEESSNEDEEMKGADVWEGEEPDEDEEMEEDDDEDGDSSESEKPYDPDAWDPHDPWWPPPWAREWDDDDREEEVLFHRVIDAISRYLTGTVIPPFVRCPICTTTQLSIRGLHLYESDDPADLPDLAPGVVLICGHMFCKPCWDAHVQQHDAMVEEADEEVPVLSCPVCRVELYHDKCGCFIPPLDMPMHPDDPSASKEYKETWGRWYRYIDDEWAWLWPQTVADGGKIEDVCKDCEMKRSRR
jgi:hypothetical protein